MRQALHRHLPERAQVDEAFGKGCGRRGQPDRSGARQLLHPAGQMDGRADRIVVHAEVVADRADQDFARMQADPGADLDAAGAAQLGRLDVHGALDRQRRKAGAHGVVLMRDRRAEQRHDAVAKDPVDGTLVTVDAVHHHAERRIQNAPGVLRVGVLDQRERALDVGEQHGDLLALALERCARAQDTLGQVPRHAGFERRRRLALAGRIQIRNGGEQLLAVAERRDAELLQIVRRERAQDLGVDVVRRESFGILAEAVTLQPGADVHRCPRCRGGGSL